MNVEGNPLMSVSDTCRYLTIFFCLSARDNIISKGKDLFSKLHKKKCSWGNLCDLGGDVIGSSLPFQRWRKSQSKFLLTGPWPVGMRSSLLDVGKYAKALYFPSLFIAKHPVIDSISTNQCRNKNVIKSCFWELCTLIQFFWSERLLYNNKRIIRNLWSRH